MRAFLMLLGSILVGGCSKEIGIVNLVKAQCESITVEIALDSPWEPAPKASDATYFVNGAIGGSSQSPLESSNNPVIEIMNLQESTFYNLFANARSRRKDGLAVAKYRKVGELDVLTPKC